MGCSANSCLNELKMAFEDPIDRVKRLENERKERQDKYLGALKIKINQLCFKREQAKPFICANGGNVCNLPCYEYQEKLETECPKCGGKIAKEYENGKTVKNVYNERKGVYEEKTFYDDNVCNKFNWVDGYLAIDMNCNAFLKYFTRRDDTDKENWVEYFCVDGERYDAPPKTMYYEFFMRNNDYLFPQVDKDQNTCFFYEGQRPELGQALGYYGYAWKHFVNIYKCCKCGYKYHIIRTSPFKFRDKSLDKYIDKPEEYQKLKKENSENKK